MDEFERLLIEYRRPVERYVRIRISSHTDAEDVLQEVYLTACRRFPALRDRQAFLAWILAIARSKCLDYFRAKARQMELPMEIREEVLPKGTKHGRAPVSAVRETLSNMADREKRILYLYYFENLPQADIAMRLNIPLGTVKSRLYAAKASFRGDAFCDSDLQAIGIKAHGIQIDPGGFPGKVSFIRGNARFIAC